MSYNRYSKFISDGKHKIVPFIEIPKRTTDYYIKYKKSTMRLDILSNQYYDDPNYGWLILQANPSLGSLEYKLVDGVTLRIPYPLDIVISGYENDINNYERLYGIE